VPKIAESEKQTLPLMNHAWGGGPALSNEKRLEQSENSIAGRSESIRVMAG